MKKLFLRHHVEQLYEIAGIAKIHVKRVAFLRVEVFPVREVVHGRMFTERKEPRQIRAFTDATFVLVDVSHEEILMDDTYNDHSSCKYSASASCQGRSVQRVEMTDSFAGNAVPEGKWLRSTARTFASGLNCAAIAHARL